MSERDDQTDQPFASADSSQPPTSEASSADAFAIEARYSGPLPPPSDFARYDDVQPGAADRILAMAEQTNLARIRALDADIKDRSLGMRLGFAAFALIIVATVALALVDKDGLAAAMFSAGVIGVIATFVQGRRPGRGGGERP